MVVLPARALPDKCESIFSSSGAETGRFQKLGRSLESALVASEDVKLIPFVELRSELARKGDYRDKVGLGREYYLLAQEEYQDLRQAEAEAHLKKAVEVLDSIYYDMVEPEAMAQILMLLGVTQLERGQAGAAYVSLRRALFLWPAMRITKGYYPEAVEASLMTACTDLRDSLSSVPLSTLERSLAFMGANHLDTLLFLILTPDAPGPRLHVVALEQSTRTVGFREVLAMGDDPAQDGELASALASRWAACAPFESKKSEESRVDRVWTFAGTYQNMAYITNPTRDLLFSWGFSFNGSYFVVPTFGFMGKLQFFSSLPDSHRDLLDELRSVRLVVGPVFALTGDWWRLFVSPGAEAHALGSFRISRDPDCKFYAADSEGYAAMCDTGRVKHYDLAMQGGLHVAMGGQFYFSNKLFLEFSADFSTYFVPFDRSFDMNFPVALEAGGGISF